MPTSDVLSIVTSALFSAVAGVLTFGLVGAAIGLLVGGCLAAIAAAGHVRPLVATTTIVGAAAGAMIGASIVETICLPDSCVPLEVGGAVVLGIASLIGVGLVAALVTRSFDEYNERLEP